jgi:SAM-dependent methyltransferase
MKVCACGSEATREAGERVRERRYGMAGDFTLLTCADCGLVRTSPQPADLRSYYPDGSYYSYQPPPSPSLRVRTRFRDAYGTNGRRRRAARALGRWLSPGMPPGPPGSILDVGCGSGQFLLALREAQWEVHGVEVNESAVAAAREAGLDRVIAGQLTDLPEETHDAVRFWHVLEHVQDPKRQLVEARKRLRPGGTLTIGVPNYRSLLSRTARNDWFYLDVPRHLWHFDRSTLRRLVESCGFRVDSVRVQSTSTPLLGTIDYRLGWGERLLKSRSAFYAALPVAAALDAAGAGDALVLTART